MDRFSDEDALTDWLHSEGITISEAVLPAGLWGLWDWERRRILVRAGMPAHYRYPALLHEAMHYLEGHRGHQCAKVERAINRRVALHLVNPAEYEAAEREYGWHTAAIATALTLPKWVIQAYRDHLESGITPQFVGVLGRTRHSWPQQSLVSYRAPGARTGQQLS